MSLNVGGSFGDYRVVKLLGKGGMGEVWLLEGASGSRVAAKILDPKSAEDVEARKRFLREAQLAMGVEHPNLVETYDVGEDPDTGLCYILMEFVSGGSLSDKISREGALPVADALRIVYQIASVLEEARKKGIVHRDIKPDNIMFGADGQAKLADLGIARIGSAGTESTTVTKTGTIIGTPAYMAPEQMLDSHKVDCRADIYSLGVVFYEMLTGVRPNKDDTIVQLLAKAMHGVPIPDVRKLRPEVSAAVAGLIGVMCAMKVSERVATPAEVALAVSQIAHGREVTIKRKRPKVLERKPLPPPVRQSGSRIPVIVLGLVVTVVGWWMVRECPESKISVPPKVEPARTELKPPMAMAVTNVVEVTPEAVVTGDVPATAESSLTPMQDTPADNEELVKATIGLDAPVVVTNAPPLVLPMGDGVELELVNCPAGSFTMGYAAPDGPAHRQRQVAITRPFWIGRVPVTVAQWQRLMGEFPLKDTDRVFGHLDIAVGRISDSEMLEFMSRLQKRFGDMLPGGYVFRWPTDAEWEYACKANVQDSEDPYVCWCFSARSQEESIAVKRQDMVSFYEAKGFEDMSRLQYDVLWPVGTKRPNRWGIYDLVGLSAEVLLDTYPGFESNTFLRRNHATPVKNEVMIDDAVDPVSICAERHFVRLMRASALRGRMMSSAFRRWMVPGHKAGIETFRIVAGPDLLREKGVKDRRTVKKNTGGSATASSVAVPRQGKPIKIVLKRKIEMELLNCPAGTFTMGWECGKSNLAPHSVTFTRQFWGSKFPVTREQWNVFMPPKTMSEQERALGGDRAAVPDATREEIEEFCERLTRKFRRQIPKGYVFRLPTMAEHEYMWRAGGVDFTGPYRQPQGLSDIDRAFLGLGMEGKSRILKEAGCDLSELDWANPSRNPLCEVGRGSANPWGMYDFSGNGDSIVLDTFPVSRLEGSKWNVRPAEDLKWESHETDPLFWSEDPRICFVMIKGRQCRGWGLSFECDKLYTLRSYRCSLFRLVVGPDLVKERKQKRNKRSR